MVELVGCRGTHAERRALASLAWVLPSLGLSGRVGTGGMQRDTHLHQFVLVLSSLGLYVW